VQRLRFIRREVPGDGGVGFGQGLRALGLGRAREVVDRHDRLILPPHLLELASHLHFGCLTDTGAHLANGG
jgi:hypothetical protein